MQKYVSYAQYVSYAHVNMLKKSENDCNKSKNVEQKKIWEFNV